MSVIFAPRARIAVNASWPGVSRKVSFRPSTSVWYAPMCWVIPPASVSTTAVERIASSSVVLPWSTWPMIVTTGGRAVRSASASSTISGSSSSAACLIVTSRSTSDAISSTSSSESDWVAVRICPRPIRILMIWDIGTPSAPDRSLTVTPDSTVTGPVGCGAGCARGGAWADRSRAARASRPRAAPPSITTRRRRPPGPPPRGRIGRFGLFGPSAMRRVAFFSHSTTQCRGERAPARRRCPTAARA